MGKSLQQQARLNLGCRGLSVLRLFMSTCPTAGCLHVACMRMLHAASVPEAGEIPRNRRPQLAAPPQAGLHSPSLTAPARIWCSTGAAWPELLLCVQIAS